MVRTQVAAAARHCRYFVHSGALEATLSILSPIPPRAPTTLLPAAGAPKITLTSNPGAAATAAAAAVAPSCAS